MSVLQVFLFGHVRIVYTKQPTPITMTRASQALLAYLLLQRHHSHPRELLAGLFWGDHTQERARSCLNTALWRLRRILDQDETSHENFLLTTPSGEVGFNCASDYWLDVAVFEEQANQVLAKPTTRMEFSDAQKLEQALQLYTGELLAGHYDDWALRERERLRRLYLNSLAHLMHYYKDHHAYQESLACGQRILDQDLLREEIHREMMRFYLENGQRPLAVRQYELCREILMTELGISPMEETQQLYTQIVQGTSFDPFPLAHTPVTADYQEVWQLLRLAWQEFNEAHRQLQQAIQRVERLSQGHD